MRATGRCGSVCWLLAGVVCAILGLPQSGLALDLEEVERVLGALVRERDSGTQQFSLESSGEIATCCPIDVNGDCSTTGAELSVLLGRYGQEVPPGSPGDFNGDGLVSGSDLSVLLAAYGCMGSSDESGPPVCP